MFVLLSGNVYCVCVYRSAAVGDDLLFWVYLTCGQLCCVYVRLPSCIGIISRGEEEVEVALYPVFMAMGEKQRWKECLVLFFCILIVFN